MAGSMEEKPLAFKQRTYKYTPLSCLINSTTFVLYFTGRKFLNIGFDPSDKFNVMIHIITPSRYVCMSHDFLNEIFGIMGNILSVLLDIPWKAKEITFLECENFKLSKMIYRGENNLVIESLEREECRVLLNRGDLLNLMDLEREAHESIFRKHMILRPFITQQFDEVVNLMENRLWNSKNTEIKLNEMKMYIKHVPDEDIFAALTMNQPNFINQLKLFALEQLALRLLMIKNESRDVNNIPMTYGAMSPLSPPSPQSSTEKFYEQELNAVDENDGIDNVRRVLIEIWNTELSACVWGHILFNQL